MSLRKTTPSGKDRRRWRQSHLRLAASRAAHEQEPSLPGGLSTLDPADTVRARVFGGEGSSVARYARLIGVGSVWALLRHELLVTLLGPLPGALGLVLRRACYPPLFGSIGPGVVFGRSVTLRNTARIRIGARVLIDDFALLDGRGDPEPGLVIGAESIVHRGVCLQAKVGPIRIGERCDIGAGSGLFSQGGIVVGNDVAIGGGARIGGGLPGPAITAADRHERLRLTRGPIRIGDDVTLGLGVTVLDGVEIGAGSVVGAGAVVRESVPAGTLVAPQHRNVLLPIEGTLYDEREQPPEARGGQPARVAGAPASRGGGAGSDEAERAAPPEPPVAMSQSLAAEVVRVAIEQTNETLPKERRLGTAAETPLQSAADSLTLVNVILATEEALAQRTGRSWELADADLVGADVPALATVGSFVAYVSRRMEPRADD